jgi:hypothetical protein
MRVAIRTANPPSWVDAEQACRVGGGLLPSFNNHGLELTVFGDY